MHNTKKKVFSVLFTFIVGVVPIFAQELPVKVGKILDLCYQFKFNSADSLMSNYFLEMKNGEEVELYMLKANILWWKIISGKNDKLTKSNYYQTLTLAENFFEKEKDKGNSHLYKGLSLYGYMARMDGLNKNYLKAFFRINNCLKYLEKSFGAEAKYPFFYLSSGLYNYHIVVTAKQYPVLLPYLYLYPKGDKNKGIEYLQLAASNSNKYLSTEGHYFLMKLFLEEKNFSASMNNVNELLQRYPQNAVFLFYKFKINLKSGKIDDASYISQQLINNLKNNTQVSGVQIKHFEQLINEEIKKHNKLKS
jgi:hypothetical protein